MPEDVKARGLSRNVVVDTALRVADEEGLEALSLRRLARALDVTPMATYRHVRNKSHLLDLMADRLLERVDLAAGEPTAWTGRLRRLLGSYQAVAAEHPAAPLLLARPFSSPTALRISETLLEILHAAGFETAQAVRLFQLISGMLLGPAIHRAFWAEAARRRPTDAARQEASIEAASGAEFGYLSGATERFLDWSPAPDADRLALDLLISGLQALADQSVGY
jgi:TetR/AcrR family tetracycline transcriptional repressor